MKWLLPNGIPSVFFSCVRYLYTSEYLLCVKYIITCDDTNELCTTTLFLYGWIKKLEAQWAEPVSLTFHSALRKVYTEPSIVLPTKFRFIWPRGFREEYCLEINQSETRIAYGGREPSIDASYQVSVHLAKRFQKRRFFRNQPIRNKNCLWWPCLLMDQDEMGNLNRRPSTDAFYQISAHLVERFQRKRFFKIDQSETKIACVSHVR